MMSSVSKYSLARNFATALVTTSSLLLAACSTVPATTTPVVKAMSYVASNPLTQSMPAIDREGQIAYVEEQNAGSARVSSLFILNPDGRDRRLIDEVNGYIYAPAWSADGKLLAYSKQAMMQNPMIYIYDTQSQTHRLVVNNKGSNLSPSFSPDGQKLLYSSTVGGNADIYKMDLADGSIRQLTTSPSTEVQPSYAPDGQSFVYTSDKKQARRPRIYRYYFASNHAEQISNEDYVASAQISADGQRLAYLNGRQAALMMLDSGQIIKLADTGLDEPARLSPSGQYVIYPMRTSPISGQSGGSLIVRPLAGGSSYAISSKNGGLIRSPIWSR